MEIFETQESEAATSLSQRLTQITIADGIFVLILIIGGLFRFVELGKIPLADVEAELAWSVWRFWQSGNELLTVHSPAYFSFTSILTQIFGFSDATMRLVPALFGLGAAALPWLARRQIGTIAALTMCAFLAISPLNVIISRTVGGDAIALFAILLLVVSILRFQSTAVTQWAYLAAAALGLGLTSAPLFYSGLLSLIVTWVILRQFSLNLFDNEPARPDRQTRQISILVGAGVFVACSSFLLWYPAGFGASARIVGQWVSQLGGNNGRVLAEPFLAIFRYEPGLVVLGLAAIIWTLWRSRPFALAALYWFSLVLVLMLLQAGVMTNAVLLTLPGYLLVGLLLQFTFSYENRYHLMSAGVAVGLFTVLMLVLVNTGRQLRVINNNPNELRYILVIMLGVVLVTAVLFILSTVDETAVVQGAAIAFLAFFLFLTWGNSWWLGHEAANNPRERWVSSGTDDDIRHLVHNLQTLSRQYTNSADGLDIASSVDIPALRWYLRDFKNIQWGDTLPANAINLALITANETELALGEQYSGSDFRLRLGEMPPPALPEGSQGWLNLLRWWFFRDSNEAIPAEQIILWVRADLAEP